MAVHFRSIHKIFFKWARLENKFIISCLRSWYSSAWYFENINYVPSMITPVYCDWSECHQTMLLVCGWSMRHLTSLQFPVRQEVNIAIFIIFYGIWQTFCRYLLYLILNKCVCQVSRLSDHKQWWCGPVR